MKLSHSLIAAALSSTLVLSACSGDDEADGGPTNSTQDGADESADASGAAGGDTGGSTAGDDAAGQTGDAAGQTGDAADQTGDAADQTGDAASSTAGSGEDEAGADFTGAISIDEADTWAEDLLTTAMESTQLDGREANDARAKAFVGAELEAQLAAGRLEAVDGKPAKWDPEESPVDFQVLAISKEGERAPALILAQSVPEEGNPVLSLITRQEDRSQFRIVWQGTMLPETSIGAFDRRSTGSAKVKPDQDKGLVTSPNEALEDLSTFLTFPDEGENPKMKTNGLAPAVRQEAQSQANSVSVQAEFSQTHEVGGQRVHSLELADGSAMTFAVLDRTSVFDVYDGMELTPPDSFWYFAQDRSITEQATMDASLFVALHIPAEGRVEVVAAREQVVGAEGD